MTEENRLQLSRRQIQMRFKWEAGLFIKELKKLQKENKKLRKAILPWERMTEKLVITLIRVLSQDGRMPNLAEFKRITGINIKYIRQLNPFFPHYKQIAKTLNLKIGRRKRK